MAESQQTLALVFSVACSLVALVLAWRGYRGISREHERRKREKDGR